MLNKKQIAAYLLTCALVTPHTAVQSSPSEKMQNIGFALVSTCGAFLCYKFASKLRYELAKEDFIQKALVSASLHLSVIGTLGYAYCAQMYTQNAYTRFL